MGGKAARNMQSRNTNKFGIQCVCWFYSQGINHVSFYDIFPSHKSVHGCYLNHIDWLHISAVRVREVDNIQALLLLRGTQQQ